METKACPECTKRISRSWYVFSGLNESYRCIHCSVLIKWNDNAYFFRISQIILFVILFYSFFTLSGIAVVGFLLAISLTEVLSNFIPSKWLVRLVSK